LWEQPALEALVYIENKIGIIFMMFYEGTGREQQ
jgi:hypothetical protein